MATTQKQSPVTKTAKPTMGAKATTSKKVAAPAPVKKVNTPGSNKNF